MNSLEPKKLALLRILQILEKYSDSEHPLTQKEIAKYLEDDYGITIERKAVSRNLTLLKDAGYEIGTAKREGFYLDETTREFTDSELRLLIDGVLSSKYIPARYSKEIIDSREGGKKTAVVSSNYHVYRALSLCDDIGLECTGIGAHVAAYYWPSALIREFAAIMSRKKNLLIFAAGWLMSVFPAMDMVMWSVTQ